jgi:hypothetical protein
MEAHRIAALIALLSLTAPEILAQQATPLVPGTRVRVGLPTVTDHDGWRISTVEHLTGKATALRGDTLFVDVGGPSPTPVALSRVATIEVSHGTKSNVGKGALIGGLVGVALGGAAYAVGCGSELYGQEVSCSGGEVAGGVVLFGLGGAAAGALIGALIRTEGWEQIPLSSLRVQPSPVTGDGLAISASLRL